MGHVDNDVLVISSATFAPPLVVAKADQSIILSGSRPRRPSTATIATGRIGCFTILTESSAVVSRINEPEKVSSRKNPQAATRRLAFFIIRSRKNGPGVLQTVSCIAGD